MKLLTLFCAILMVFTTVSFVSTCQINCECRVDESECFLSTCQDELDYITSSLIVHGKLCPRHRIALSQNDKTLQLLLMDDSCVGLVNCRHVFIIFDEKKLCLLIFKCIHKDNSNIFKNSSCQF